MKMIKLMDFNKFLKFLKMALAYWAVIRAYWAVIR